MQTACITPQEYCHFEEPEESVAGSSENDATSAEHVRVVIRCRPLNPAKEKEGRDQLDISPDGHAIDVKSLVGGDRHYTFTCVADENKDQCYLYKKTGKPIVDCALEGFNGAIVAYGQTGSGKTYTMQGPGLIGKSRQSSESQGIIQSVCETIFSRIQKNESENNAVSFSVNASYLEIYNETLVDLLVSGDSKKGKKPAKLTIREDMNGGIIVVGQTSVVVKSPQDCYKLLRDGAVQRSVGATKMNAESSRSHAIFTLNIEKKNSEKKTKRRSRLHLVDLAGSERQKGTGATGLRLKEASGINKSLSALGNVVNALSSMEAGGKREARNVRIPSCRDSKLTFLLKDSLGGNSKLCIIATISPAKASIEETVSTLEFAKRCAAVRNEAVVNEQLTEDIGELQKEVLRLQDANKQLRNNLTKAKAIEIELRTAASPVVRAAHHSPVHIMPVEKPKVRKEMGVQTEENIDVPDEGKDILKSVKTKDITGALDSLIERKLEEEGEEQRIENLCILLTNAITREKYHTRREEEMKRKVQDSHQRWMEMLRTNEDLNRSLQDRENELVKYREQDLERMEESAGQRLRRAMEVLQVQLENNPEILLLRHRVAALESDLGVTQQFGQLSDKGREGYERQIMESQQKWLEMVITNNELLKALNKQDKKLQEVREKGVQNVYGSSGEQLRKELKEIQQESENNPELVLLRHRVKALENELVEFAELSMQAHKEAQEICTPRRQQASKFDEDGIEFATELAECDDDGTGLSEDDVLASLNERSPIWKWQWGLETGVRKREGVDEEGKEFRDQGVESPTRIEGLEMLTSIVTQKDFVELESSRGEDYSYSIIKGDTGVDGGKGAYSELRKSVETLEVAWGCVKDDK